MFGLEGRAYELGQGPDAGKVRLVVVYRHAIVRLKASKLTSRGRLAWVAHGAASNGAFSGLLAFVPSARTHALAYVHTTRAANASTGTSTPSGGAAMVVDW